MGEESPIDAAHLEHTLEEAGLLSGDKVFIEFMLESRVWPSAVSDLVENKGQSDVQRTKGLCNLGNTCYMNSAMQCIANTPYIREFFTAAPTSNRKNAATGQIQTSASYTEIALASKEQSHPPYKYQVNPNNVMAHDGKFVIPFADTIGKMWDSGSIFGCYPMGFKAALGKVNEQFQGRMQHDSHEFLNILTDALHEELNIRQRKPYIESPDNREDIKKVNDEFWANFLRRNWSFMVFIFYGQMKSLLKCDVCSLVRVNYQAFSNLSVPIPNSNTLLLSIVVNQIPSELAAILRRDSRLFIVDSSDEVAPIERYESQNLLEQAEKFA